jgi:hypothetical protein
VGFIQRGTKFLSQFAVFFRSADTEDAGHKSAPCTPCLQRDVLLDSCLVADLTNTQPRLAHLECAGSTPRLSRAQNCRAFDGRANTSQPIFDCDCDIDDITAVKHDCFVNGSMTAPTLHHCHGGDVNGMSGNDRSRRRRRQRSREQHRINHRVTQKCAQSVQIYLFQVAFFV